MVHLTCVSTPYRHIQKTLHEMSASFQYTYEKGRAFLADLADNESRMHRSGAHLPVGE